MSLFQVKSFVGAAGSVLPWRIECDALTDEDWETIAAIASPKIPAFGAAVGVPTGGHKLAIAVGRYRRTDDGPFLIVDDVWTTGASMNRMAGSLIPGRQWHGFVAFARGPLPPHVRCFMQTEF